FLLHYLSLSFLPRPPCSTVFPYTTLFRSGDLRVEPEVGGNLRDDGQFLRRDFASRDPGDNGVAPVLLHVGHGPVVGVLERAATRDRKSTRLNSSHVKISYAVFCLKKKKKL